MNTHKSVSSGSVKKRKGNISRQEIMEMIEYLEETVLGRIDLNKSLVLLLQIHWFSKWTCTGPPDELV